MLLTDSSSKNTFVLACAIAASLKWISHGYVEVNPPAYP